MFNLVNFETGERFDNFPYSVSICNIGLGCEFYPDFYDDDDDDDIVYLAFSRLKIPFNDDFVLGKTDDVKVPDCVYKSLLKHYQDNYK